MSCESCDGCNGCKVIPNSDEYRDNYDRIEWDKDAERSGTDRLSNAAGADHKAI